MERAGNMDVRYVLLINIFLCTLLPLSQARTRQDVQFNEHQFRNKVAAALVTARQILKAEKEPVYYASADSVPHAYEDKYMLAEFLTKGASRSVLNLFRQVNATDAVIADAARWATADRHTVLLQFTADQRCALDHWALREVESPKRVVETKVRRVVIVRSAVLSHTPSCFDSGGRESGVHHHYHHGSDGSGKK